MVDYKKKYLKYKKKYLESKKLFHGGAWPGGPANLLALESPLTIATGTALAPLQGMEDLAHNILDTTGLINVPQQAGGVEAFLSLRDILDTDWIFDNYIIRVADLENLKESIALQLTNFPVGRGAQQLCLDRHGVSADEAWARDAFLQPGDRGQPQDITERIRRWLNQTIEYNSYSDIIRCVLGREGPDSGRIRHILENRVSAQRQCERIIGPFNNPTTCYMCGIVIDIWHAGTAHCEHLLPVGQALAIYWLAKANVTTPAQQDFLQHEYRWSCSCCNRVKNDRVFVRSPDLRTGTPFQIDDVSIMAFFTRLCEKIDPDRPFFLQGDNHPDWAGEPEHPYLEGFWPGRPDDHVINGVLPNGDLGGKLGGTETFEILCQRKKFQARNDIICTQDWIDARLVAIRNTLTPVTNIINHNFLRRGRGEWGARRQGPTTPPAVPMPVGFNERAYCFVELAKIEMKVKIILALGDDGLVELFCRTNAARRSIGLGLAIDPAGLPPAPLVPFALPAQQLAALGPMHPGLALPRRRPRRPTREERAERAAEQAAARQEAIRRETQERVRQGVERSRRAARRKTGGEGGQREENYYKRITQ